MLKIRALVLVTGIGLLTMLGGWPISGQVRGPAAIGLSPAATAAGYTLIDLHPPTGFSLSIAFGISRGKIVGTGYTGSVYHALLWSGSAGSVVDLHPVSPFPCAAGYYWPSSTCIGAYTSAADGIDGDQIAGFAGVNVQAPNSSSFITNPHRLLWSSDGSVVSLQPPQLYNSNVAGNIDFPSVIGGGKQAGVGQWPTGPSAAANHAFLWSSNAASAVDLHPSGPAGPGESGAHGTNGLQQVGYVYVGVYRKAALWLGTAASYVDLHPSSALSSEAIGIHGGVQVGYSGEPDGGYHARLWTGTKASAIDLGYGVAFATNGGQHVGNSSGFGAGSHAMLWRTGSAPLDLHPPGFLVSSANGIDESGNIVGSGVDASGVRRALLWKNTPASPTAPSNVRVSQVGFSGNNARLTWDYGNDPIDGFSIEGKVPFGDWAPLTSIAAPQARTIDLNPPNVPSFGTVSYRIRAYQGSSSSGPSNEAALFQLKFQTFKCVDKSCIGPTLWPLSADIDNAIYVDFAPNPSRTLKDVAGQFGYDHFNWTSQVLLPPVVTTITDYTSMPIVGGPLWFVDPPLGGYGYLRYDDQGHLWPDCKQTGPTADFLPFYWDEQPTCVPYRALSDNVSLHGANLNFQDRPHADQLGQSDYIQFFTSLVGVPVGSSSPTPLASFFWSSNNHIAGLAIGTRLADSGSSGSGSGGIFNVMPLNPEDLPVSVRTLLIQSGFQGVSTTPKIDKDAPMTTAFLSGPQGTNGWYTGPVQVTLIATDIDGPSDIATTSYRFDGGSAISYSSPFSVSGGGAHTIVFGSVDRALNAETPLRSQSFKIDATPPVIVPTVAGTLVTSGWYRSSVTISWSISDSESGIATSSGCTSTTLTADTAGVTLTCSATNGAGLSASVPVTIKIDRTPPVISGMPAGCTLWPPNYKMVQVATVTAGDALSGMATFNVSGVSNEPPAPGEVDVVIAGTGLQPRSVQLRAERSGSGNGRTYTLTAVASDLAGNTGTATATCTVPHDQGN